MFNVSKNDETNMTTLAFVSVDENGETTIKATLNEFNAKRGSQTKAVIDMINKSWDADAEVKEILTSDELVAGALKIYELCGSKLNPNNAANVARSHINALMNEKVATSRPVNFTVGKRGRKAGSKNAPKVAVEETAETASTDVAPEIVNDEDNMTIGETIVDDVTVADADDNMTIGETVETATEETVENVESPVKSKAKKSKKNTEAVAA